MAQATVTLTVRLPKRTHEALKRLAKKQRQSVNRIVCDDIAAMISQAVVEDKLAEQPAEQVA